MNWQTIAPAACVAVLAAVLLTLSATGVTLWPAPAAAPIAPPPPEAQAAPPSALPPSALPPAAHVPPVDPAALNGRCFAAAKHNDTDPDVLAADQRICDCLERTLEPGDFDMLIRAMSVDSAAADAAQQNAALYRLYGMTEAQFSTRLRAVRTEGRKCLSH
jgi:hypothetical protein